MLIAIVLLVTTLLVYLYDYARCAKLMCTSIYTENDVQKFLGRFKIKCKPLEVTHITIPEQFDQVYVNYEKLQNHQKSGQEDILAHVFVSGNEVVAADVCSVRLDGFMIPLTEFKNQMK